MVFKMAVASLLTVAAVSAHRAQSELWTVYTSVLDRTGAPVAGAMASDFVVREDGVAREVLRVTTATDPLQIALLVDTSQEIRPDLFDLRLGIRAFLKEIHTRNDVALIGFGGRPTTLVDYTRDPARLEKGVAQLFARPQTGSYLLQTLIETSKGLRKRKTGRPVIAVVTTEGPEFSEVHYQVVLDYIRDAGATLHSFMLSKPGLKLDEKSAESAQELELTLARGAAMTGGRQEDLSTVMALGVRMQTLAIELNNQYQVTYARPPMLIPPRSISVTVKRPDWIVRAPRVF
jgi:VWFA-related protein